jgi:hypothetical protein
MFLIEMLPKLAGSLAIEKLRVQTGATSLRAMVALRSQKASIAHARQKMPGESKSSTRTNQGSTATLGPAKRDEGIQLAR